MNKVDQVWQIFMNLQRQFPLIPLGTQTEFGTVEAIGSLSGERYYWLINDGVVSMLPASMVETGHNDDLPTSP